MKLEISPAVDIEAVDIVFAVRTGGELLGRLKNSRSSVAWLPANAPTARRLRWERLAELMVEHGRRIRRPVAEA